MFGSTNSLARSVRARVLGIVWGRIVLTLVFAGVLFAAPSSVLAQPGPGEVEYCFCLTPRNSLPAAGNSKVRIKWRGMWFEVTPAPGDTATQIMDNLRNQIAAAFPGDTVGAVATDPMTGRAVFCVKGPRAGSGGANTRETDANFKECTFRSVRGANNHFLRRVGGAFVANVAPKGGDVLVQVGVENGGVEQTVDVSVPTSFGQPNLLGDVVAALNSAGFVATLGSVEVGPGQSVTGFHVDAGPGLYDLVFGLGMTTNDPGINDLTVFGQDLGDAIPTVSQWGLIVLALLFLAAGTLLYGRGQFALVPAGAGIAMAPSREKFAMNVPLLIKCLCAALAVYAIACAAAYRFQGDLAVRDAAGGFMTAALAAYVLHLWMAIRKPS